MNWKFEKLANCEITFSGCPITDCRRIGWEFQLGHKYSLGVLDCACMLDYGLAVASTSIHSVWKVLSDYRIAIAFTSGQIVRDIW